MIQPDPNTKRPLLDVADLAVSFDNASSASAPRIQAVAGVNMTIYPRQTLAVVGESGCGKSVTAMSTMQLVPRPPGRFDRGTILFEGRDLLSLPERAMLDVRGKDIAMIFQEPMTSLNPVYTIGDQIMEAILLHQSIGAEGAREIALQAMRDVGIPKPEQRIDAYPHQFSGGMRQRVMIAMALACQPKLLLADEPTTALDVTIQAQILELLQELQRTRGMGIMLITHNLGVVAENADVICVMYAGRVVEYAKVYELFDRPLHPYTRGLFNSIPKLRDQKHRLVTVDELVNDPAEYRKLPGHDKGVVPWWPTMPPPAGARALGHDDAVGSETVLHEVERDHWVGCWRTEHLDALPGRRPDIDYRRGAV
ncbi:MAG: ABC transporter ATP-binding protein [Phycisphaerales bacterium]|nr:ABC transporter ATP-binding protein [Phycisphaerales bacterium]